MANRKEAADKKKELSGQISTLIRTLALSVLAVAWLFISGSKDAPELVKAAPKSVMLFVAALCLLTLAADLIQYVAGYLQVSKDYEVAKASSDPDVVVFSESRVRNGAFWIKIFLGVSATLLLVVSIAWALFAVNSPSQKSGDCSAVLNNSTIFIGR